MSIIPSDQRADLRFNSSGTLLNMSYYANDETSYDPKNVERLREDILMGLEKLDLVNLTDLKSDVRRMKEISFDGNKFDEKGFKKRVGNWLKLLPFLYNENGKALLPTLDAETKERLRAKIRAQDMDGLDNFYSDMAQLHLKPLVQGVAKEKGMGSLAEFYSSFENNFMGKTLKAAKLRFANNGTVSPLRKISLEKVPALAALLRGCVGSDCSIHSVPYFPLLKNTHVYWIRSGDNPQAPPSGYILVTEVQKNGRSFPYVVTANGNLTASQVQAAMKVIMNEAKVDRIYTSGGRYGTVNSDSMKVALNPRGSSEEKVDFPEIWNKVGEHRNKQYSAYYDSDQLAQATFIPLSKLGIEELSYTQSSFESAYPKINSFNDLPLFDRALLAHQASDSGEEGREIQVLKTLGLSKEQFEVARPVYSPERGGLVTAEAVIEASNVFKIPFVKVGLRAVDWKA